MQDPTNKVPKHKIPITVGYSDLEVPIETMEFLCHVTQLSTDLPDNLRAAHMSRLMEACEKFRRSENHHFYEVPAKIAREILLRCGYARVAYVTMKTSFKYGFEGPVSKKKLYEAYNTKIKIKTHCLRTDSDLEDTNRIILSVNSYSVCPHAGHTQLCDIKVGFDYKKSPGDIQDLIKKIKSCGSSPIIPSRYLPPEDHSYYTLYAHKHPRFVEDMARCVAAKLAKKPNLKVKVTNFESIHPQNAFAVYPEYGKMS